MPTLRPTSRLSRAVIAFVAITFVSLALFSKRGALDWYRITQRNRELESRLLQLRAERMQMEEQLSAFERDREAQERTIKQVLGYVKSGETVIQFE